MNELGMNGITGSSSFGQKGAVKGVGLPTLLDDAPFAILVLNDDFKVKEMNSTARHLLGVKLVELYDQDLFSVFDLADVSEGERRQARFQSDGRWMLPSGKELHIGISIRRQHLAMMNVNVCYLEDVTEKRFTEKLMDVIGAELKGLSSLIELEAIANESARLAVHALSDWSVVFSCENTQVRVLASAHKDLEQDGVVNEVVKPLEDKIMQSMPELDQGRSLSLPMKLIFAEKDHATSRSGAIWVLPLKSGTELLGCLCLGVDRGVTRFSRSDCVIAEELAARVALLWERAIVIQRLKEMKDQADAANSAKTHFLANMSHEIRTPLGAILGFVELLLTPGASISDQLLWGMKIRSNGKHLLRIIDDILDLSKVDAGKLDLAIAPMDLGAMLSNIYSSYVDSARKRGVQWRVVFDTPLPRFIETDETRLHQVLSNLVGNAIKFTHQGDVELRARLGDHNQIHFSVKDSGPGLTSEQASRLFKPFSQGGSSHARKCGGSGLGLALAQKIARCLNGDVQLVKTEPGEGSQFEAWIQPRSINEQRWMSVFRAQVTDALVEEVTSSVRLDGVQILVADDSPDNQMLLDRFLTKAGAQVDRADNGVQALEMALSKKYDVVLMDIQMPLKDGLSATLELRARGYDRPIVAITAYGLKDEAERCLEAGCSLFLNKPVRRATLLSTVHKVAHELSD